MIDAYPLDLSPSPEALESRVGDETVILHLGNDTYYGLDTLGTEIWGLLKERVPLTEIRDRLAADYGVSAATIEADMVRFLDDLMRNGLLVHG
ncbi:PqqD family protein [Rubellimicrobium rubrum]|uniref:PqqD family protein n=1 Tax=Rubellimicrobium rubrum TaxID=2585369 RepID=A0A5C4MR80_9RHOB|nr:PqqD family protein [Rubellimicrobium rubrum]TNC46859.1 PqqD family protein [Rubellimicrobium rubrum]